MNKQECRHKNKRHFHHHKAPDIEPIKTSQPGANENVPESLSKAPEVKTTDRLALVFGIGISALTMAMIYLSGAK